MKLFLTGFLALTLFSGLAHAEEKEVYSTKMDFDSTMLDGKMKAPSGFFLQGRNKQSLTNLVKLRSSFKPQLKDSKAAVRSLVK
ncbi:MAG: hypothetical protein V4655_05975 [Bdellovibrionota bacterium]|nr:MAG: hypothetical protein EOP10_15990 [Pseudomonadota bacterium]